MLEDSTPTPTAEVTAERTREPVDETDQTLPLTAYRVVVSHRAPEPAERRRAWMDATDVRFANRCLPLLIANQAGWWIRNESDFVARWDGRNTVDAVSIRHAEGTPAPGAASHFGHGIVTFTMPLLFRTPPGWNLLVRGPANLPKDGVSALEGIVETDWAVSTFTMNWQITRPHADVEFRAGEPICMVVPQRRGELERFRPDIAPFYKMPDAAKYQAWRQSRSTHLSGDEAPGNQGRGPADWQREYMRGVVEHGQPVFPEHQRRLDLQPFAETPLTLREDIQCAPKADPS
jgi:hypothetical protein